MKDKIVKEHPQTHEACPHESWQSVKKQKLKLTKESNRNSKLQGTQWNTNKQEKFQVTKQETWLRVQVHKKTTRKALSNTSGYTSSNTPTTGSHIT